MAKIKHMSNKLYTSNGSSGNIKIEHIDDALRTATFKGKLHGVDRVTRERFTEEFEKVAGDMSYQVGHHYNAHEVNKILDHMKISKTDKITDTHIEHVRKILTDQNYNTE